MAAQTLSRLSKASAVTLLALLLPPAAALAQGTLFVEGDKVGIGVATPATALHVQKSDGTAKVQVQEISGTTQVRELFRLDNNGGPFFIFADSSSATSYSFAMAGNGDFIMSHQQTPGVQFRMSPTGNVTISGTLTQSSSRSVKQDIEALDSEEVLARVLALPVAEWSYSNDPSSARHVGPMAEDFHAAFGLGQNDKGISAADTGGVALAAIQGLHQLLRERDREVAAQKETIIALTARLAALEQAAGDR